MRVWLCASVVAGLVACGATQQGSLTAQRAQPATEPSPYDSGVWIAKLDDPAERDHAVTQLETLGDPAAIRPLGEAWLANGRPPRILGVMIGIAKPLTAEEAKASFLTEFEQSGRKSSWNEVLPYLTLALVEMDESDPRTVESALAAADALGEAKVGTDVLISFLQRRVSKKTIAVEVAAIRALGKHAGNPAAAKALAAIISREGPPHPRTLPGAARQAEEMFGLYLTITGASINALAELRAPAAVDALVLAMYRTPELFVQVRRALVASGPVAKAALRQALAGKYAAVNTLFQTKSLGEYCGDQGDQPCMPVSAMQFYPAIVLGDFHDPSVAPELVATLATTPTPPYYIDNTPAPSTQHTAALDSLARLGAADAATSVYQLWKSTKTPLELRAIAIAAYPFLVRDTTGVRELGRIAADNLAQDALRIEAATAFARTATTAKDVDVLLGLGKKYLKAADDKTKAAARAKTDGDKQMNERSAKAYVGYARMFQTHVARLHTGVLCKADLDCYARTLQATPDDIIGQLTKYRIDFSGWSAEDKAGLVEAAIDRAMLELGKQGASAAQYTDALLAAVHSDRRVIRQAILRALPKIAPLPCAACVDKLDAAVKAGEGKTSLGDLNIETQILRNYFVWAGG